MLFRRLYTDKMLKAMSKDCLKELEFTDRDKDLILEDMEVMTDFELHRFCGGYKVLSFSFNLPAAEVDVSFSGTQHLKKYCLKKDEWMSAGKIQTLQRLLPELKANGDRVLLFSQFTQVLDILEVVLNTLEIKYLKLTGQTAVTERQGLVDEYSNDPDITVFRESLPSRFKKHRTHVALPYHSPINSCWWIGTQFDDREHGYFLRSGLQVRESSLFNHSSQSH